MNHLDHIRRIPEFGAPGARRERRIVTALLGVIGALAIAYGAVPAVAHLVNLLVAVLVAIGVATGLVLILRWNAREGRRS